MAQPNDIQQQVGELENRIHKFIHLHDTLRAQCQDLLAENRRLQLELEEERAKSRRVEEGYRNLQEVEQQATRQRVAGLKRKIGDIVGEIDRSLTLINVQQHK
jgi:regulator of replication initiation timing